MDGFDNLSNTTITSKGWSASPAAAFSAGRYPAPPGSAASQSMTLFAASGTPAISKTLPSTYATLVMGCAVNLSSLQGVASTRGMLNLVTSGNVTVAAISVNVSGFLQVTTGAGATLIATGSTVINVNTWYYIELKLVVGTSGTCEVHLDGSTEIASTVGNFGTTNMARTFLQSTGGQTALFDDLYILDTTGSSPQNTFLGPSRIITPMPTGAGTHTQWAPNGAASNYLCVNEAPPDGDTTYVSDATPGDLDSYVFGQADGGASIFAVQTNHYARKDDANTRQIAPLIRQAGTDYIGNTFTEAASYSDFTQIWNQDPTGSNWTPAVFNGDEFGVKEIA